MTDRIDEIASELNSITSDVRAAFGSLSGAQLNWKPAPDSWSVAQCLDHLITINSLYFPLFESFRAGTARPTLWARISPFSGLLGRLMIRSLGPDNPKKMKTSRVAEPSTSVIGADIVDRFDRHQSELIEHLRGIPPGVDRTKTIVASPLMGLVTYSLDDCMTIIVVHEQRHVQQAKRVLEQHA